MLNTKIFLVVHSNNRCVIFKFQNPDKTSITFLYLRSSSLSLRYLLSFPCTLLEYHSPLVTGIPKSFLQGCYGTSLEITDEQLNGCVNIDTFVYSIMF